MIYAYHTNHEKTDGSRNELMFLYASCFDEDISNRNWKTKHKTKEIIANEGEVINSDQEKAAEFKETMMKLLGAVGDVIHMQLSHMSYVIAP